MELQNQKAVVGFQTLTDYNSNLSITDGEITGVEILEAQAADFSGDVSIVGSVDIDSDITLTDSESSINITNPAGIRLGTSATTGHVLTADSEGRGTWQAVPSDPNAADKDVFYSEDSNDAKNLALITNNQTPDFSNGSGVIYIGNSATAPSGASVGNGGILYVLDGELWYRGSNGTASNLASK